MNETMELLLNRGSVRTFTDQPISVEIINNILEAGIKSATGGNLQPVSIIKIMKPENREWFVKQRMQSFIEKAPLNLLFCLDFNRLKKWAKLNKAPFVMDKSFRHFWITFQDVIIAAQSIETAANSYGLGSCYVGSTIDMIEDIKEKFKLPKGVIPIVLMAIGYPSKQKRVSPKLTQNIVVHSEEYREPSNEEITEEFNKKYGDSKIKITPDKLEEIMHIVEVIDGEKAAQEIKEYIEINGGINSAIKYFCLRYPAHFMACDNSILMEILEKDGLEWTMKKNTPLVNEFYIDE